MKKLLSYLNKNIWGTEGEFEVKSIVLSERGDCRVITANAISSIHQASAVYGYLCDAVTGETLVMDSNGPYAYLEDKYDYGAAKGKKYVLRCGFGASDKPQVVNLRKKLNIGYAPTLKYIKYDSQWFGAKSASYSSLRLCLLSKTYQQAFN